MLFDAHLVTEIYPNFNVISFISTASSDTEDFTFITKIKYSLGQLADKLSAPDEDFFPLDLYFLC